MARPKKVKELVQVSDTKQHVVIECARFIVANMSEFNQLFWTQQAKKKNQNLEQAVVEYLLKDFGLPTDSFNEYLIGREKYEK